MKMGKTLRVLTLASSLVVIGCTEDVAVHDTYYEDRHVSPRYVREEPPPRPMPREDSDVRVSVDTRGGDDRPAPPPPDDRGDVSVSYDNGDARTDVDVVSEAPDDTDAGYFENDLQPYGDWVVTADFGRSFRPRGVSVGWRPYSEGHWVYTDDGWLWASDEPFGWATYHYGRWYEDPRVGWVWVPGRTWAPAWVAWRHGGGSAGWAPLPPLHRGEASVSIDIQIGRIHPDEYCFVDERYIDAPRVRDHFRPREQNVTIINNTTNITNITTVNNKVINHGPSTLEVEKATGHKVKKVQVVQASSKGTARETANEVAVFKPNLPPKKKKPAPTDAHAADAKNVTNSGGLKTLETNDPNNSSKNKKKVQADVNPPRTDTVDVNPPKKKVTDKNTNAPLATDSNTTSDPHKDKHIKPDTTPPDNGKSDPGKAGKNKTPIEDTTGDVSKNKDKHARPDTDSDSGKNDSPKSTKNKVQVDSPPPDVSKNNKKKTGGEDAGIDTGKSGKGGSSDKTSSPKSDDSPKVKKSDPSKTGRGGDTSNGDGKGNGNSGDKKKDKNGNDTGDATR